MRKANHATPRCFTLFIILSFIVTATGCQTNLALEKNKTTLDTSKESIALMTIRISNEVKQQPQLNLFNIDIKTGEAKKARRFKNIWRSHYVVRDQFYEYPISFALPPGKNTILLIEGGIVGGPPVIFGIEPSISFNLEPDSIVYVGHLQMVNRMKKEGEKQLARFRPFDYHPVNLALAYDAYEASGLAEGTMELTISDRFDEDIKNFKQRYPLLENYTVKKDIMKPKEEQDKNRTP